MDHEQLPDENLGWPSYVDFLASFAFVLIFFVVWSVNLITGAEKEREIQTKLTDIKNGFIDAGFEAFIEGHKLRIPLRNKVSFQLNGYKLDETARRNLREAGYLIASNPHIRRVIVYGYADKVQPRHDQFFNWQLSVNRAMEVLRYLYLCSDCGYRPEDIRPKLALRGDGDLDARILQGLEAQRGDAGDRRVDIILDQDDDKDDHQ
jgi:outer membrane protein OmpA-like peptidoglycan-associated protein